MIDEKNELSAAEKKSIETEFINVSTPVMDFLKKNFSPHHTIIITGSHAEILEGYCCFTASKNK